MHVDFNLILKCGWQYDQATCTTSKTTFSHSNCHHVVKERILAVGAPWWAGGITSVLWMRAFMVLLFSVPVLIVIWWNLTPKGMFLFVAVSGVPGKTLGDTERSRSWIKSKNLWIMGNINEPWWRSLQSFGQFSAMTEVSQPPFRL